MIIKLTFRDHELIGELKAIRDDLRKQADYLTDKKLAEKWEVSERTINRIPTMTMDAA
jgi:hypothetical protein